MGIASIEKACWILGAALLTSYGAVRAYADGQRQEGLATFTYARMALSASRLDLATDLPDQSTWSDSRIRAHALNLVSQPHMLPEAVLRIPGVKLTVPVYADASASSLNRGVGLIGGTARPDSAGNVTIAGHRDGFFRVLKDVAVGDRLEIESLSGTRVYRISALSVVRPEDTRSLRQIGHSVVTLVTCYPFYYVGNAPRRYIVRAVAVDP
jgi:sortase A